MKDGVLVNEVRKKVSTLESKYETVARDLEAARVFLAMLERDLANDTHPTGNRNHVELVGDCVLDLLSLHKDMHRKDLLNHLMEKGIHIGYDHNRDKQLAGLSTILSKDARFKPVKEKNGYWTLTTLIDSELSMAKFPANDVLPSASIPVPTAPEVPRADLLASASMPHGLTSLPDEKREQYSGIKNGIKPPSGQRLPTREEFLGPMRRPPGRK